MRKRTTFVMVAVTGAVMGSLWAHDVATTEATAAALSDQIVQVESEKRAAVMEGGDLQAMLDKARAEIDEQEALVAKVKDDWAKEKKAKLRARADLSVQDEKVAALGEQVMELQDQVKKVKGQRDDARAEAKDAWLQADTFADDIEWLWANPVETWYEDGSYVRYDGETGCAPSALCED